MARSDALKPFYFIVSFWGKEFRKHFLRLSAASLLAPGNIPSLSNPVYSRLIICTTKDDWSAIQDDPLFCHLASHIQPVFFELRRPAPEFLKPILREKQSRDKITASDDNNPESNIWITPDDIFPTNIYRDLEHIGNEIGHKLTIHHHYALRILFMNAGHKAGACQAFEEKANAVFLGPDLMMADGAVIELERLVNEGHKVVLTATLRFAQDECLTVFQNAGHMVAGQPLTLSPRQLVEMVFKHMHPETACFEFDSPYFCDTATSSLWKIPGDDGILLHNLNFYPLLVNYEDLTVHHADYFDAGGTIDGQYIARHFDPNKHITVVTDSDRLMLASFTRSTEYYYPLTTGWRKTHPWVRERYKTYLIRKTLYSSMGDIVKRHFYTLPIRFHSKPFTPVWDEIQQRAATVARNAVSSMNVWDSILGFTLPKFRFAWIRQPQTDRRPPLVFYGKQLCTCVWDLSARLSTKFPQHIQQKLKRFAKKCGE